MIDIGEGSKQFIKSHNERIKKLEETFSYKYLDKIYFNGKEYLIVGVKFSNEIKIDRKECTIESEAVFIGVCGMNDFKEFNVTDIIRMDSK